MTLTLLLLACLLTCAGQIAQKYAVEGWRGVDTGVAQKLRSPWLWLALLCLEVGVAYPMLSLNFVLITLVARYLFKETIDLRHWLGVGLVIAGVVLLGQHA